jgi:hypothetical protein
MPSSAILRHSPLAAASALSPKICQHSLRRQLLHQPWTPPAGPTQEFTADAGEAIIDSALSATFSPTHPLPCLSLAPALPALPVKVSAVTITTPAAVSAAAADSAAAAAASPQADSTAAAAIDASTAFATACGGRCEICEMFFLSFPMVLVTGFTVA